MDGEIQHRSQDTVKAGIGARTIILVRHNWGQIYTSLELGVRSHNKVGVGSYICPTIFLLGAHDSHGHSAMNSSTSGLIARWPLLTSSS